MINEKNVTIVSELDRLHRLVDFIMHVETL